MPFQKISQSTASSLQKTNPRARSTFSKPPARRPLDSAETSRSSQGLTPLKFAAGLKAATPKISARVQKIKLQQDASTVFCASVARKINFSIFQAPKNTKLDALAVRNSQPPKSQGLAAETQKIKNSTHSRAVFRLPLAEKQSRPSRSSKKSNSIVGTGEEPKQRLRSLTLVASQDSFNWQLNAKPDIKKKRMKRTTDMLSQSQ